MARIRRSSSRRVSDVQHLRTRFAEMAFEMHNKMEGPAQIKSGLIAFSHAALFVNMQLDPDGKGRIMISGLMKEHAKEFLQAAMALFNDTRDAVHIPEAKHIYAEFHMNKVSDVNVAKACRRPFAVVREQVVRQVLSAPDVVAAIDELCAAYGGK